jgi:hypothetical protein
MIACGASMSLFKIWNCNCQIDDSSSGSNIFSSPKIYLKNPVLFFFLIGTSKKKKKHKNHSFLLSSQRVADTSTKSLRVVRHRQA